ncbi:MAG: hypothetical protein NDJ89_00975 [Oligoflexia bacterium]|nr:hypothetical protein [Oligoflexia bacterium]
MMKLNWKSGFCVLGLFMGSGALAGSFFASGEGPVVGAQQAYAQGDFRKMMLEIKAGLEAAPQDRAIRENLLSLYRKAREVAGTNGLPADWELPPELTNFRISTRRSEVDTSGVAYLLKVNSSQSESGSVRQLQIVRHPDEVVLDKQKEIGDWSENSGAGFPRGTPMFSFQGARTKRPVPAGLYLLKIELTNGKKVDGWFILDELANASDGPRVSSPTPGQIFGSGNPTFRWTDFRSPEYQSQELRSLWVSVFDPAAKNYEQKWSESFGSPSLQQEATVGPSKLGRAIEALAPGEYRFTVEFSERHRFGDLQVSRASSVNRVFAIKP